MDKNYVSPLGEDEENEENKKEEGGKGRRERWRVWYGLVGGALVGIGGIVGIVWAGIPNHEDRWFIPFFIVYTAGFLLWHAWWNPS